MKLVLLLLCILGLSNAWPWDKDWRALNVEFKCPLAHKNWYAAYVNFVSDVASEFKGKHDVEISDRYHLDCFRMHCTHKGVFDNTIQPNQSRLRIEHNCTTDGSAKIHYTDYFNPHEAEIFVELPTN